LAPTTPPQHARSGAAFLLEDVLAEKVFTREDLSEEHIAIGRMVEEFWANEVEPNLPAIRQKKPGLALEIIRKSSKLGLLGISVPEKFGGMEMDLPSVMVVAEVMGRDASYAGWHSAHTGIGSLPILFFGTEQQKQKYLPKLVNGELLAAYALTEPLAGSAALAARESALSISIKYAKQRKAFGVSIASFGAIQHKLAEMAIRIFATESMAWRVVGLIETQLSSVGHDSSDAVKAELKAVEEYAAECSMVKVFAAEMLDYVADEGVQIHGGYGFHQDYAVERIYRDARINRLFEGTSEINRLVISGMPLKRATRGLLPLFEAAQKELNKNGADENSDSNAPEARLVRNAKKISLLTLGIAHKKYGAELEKHQEVVMSLSDLFMETFAMESVLLRCRKIAAAGKSIAGDICAVFLRDALTRMQAASQNVIGACAEGSDLHSNMTRLRSYVSYEPVNAIALRRNIAEQLLGSERYLF